MLDYCIVNREARRKGMAKSTLGARATLRAPPYTIL